MKTPYPNPERVPSLWFPLVKKFYQEHYPSGKPNKAEPTWVLRQNNSKIVCSLRLKRFPDAQLLMSMVTDPSYRKIGLGSHLINSIHDQLNLLPSYCFALDHLVSFYTANNFIEIETDRLPEELRKRFQSYKAQGRKITPMIYISS
jgi:N-acetylglutamate synthase-like GNAT family acetyltransferase